MSGVRISLLALLALTWLTVPALAQTHAAHEHGAAAMNLAVEDDGFEVTIDGALAGFLSFEHEPSTEAQRTEVKEMAAKFGRADELFKAPAAAGCKVESIALASAHLPAELLAPYAAPPGGHHHHDEADHDHDEGDHHHDEADHDHAEGDHPHGHGEADHDHDDGEHADLEAELDFKCSNASALDSLALDAMFASFPALEELRVQVVSPKGQSAAELSKGSAVLKW